MEIVLSVANVTIIMMYQYNVNLNLMQRSAEFLTISLYRTDNNPTAQM